jgi:RNA-directed DNA polymerase
MKRYGNLWEKIISRNNIELALKNAQRGKKHYKEVIRINKNPEHYITEIMKMLSYKTFRNAKYEVITRVEGGKLREIKKLPFYPDRVIHHAIMQILEPIWIKSLIVDTYQSIKGRGIHLGMKRIKNALKNKDGTGYCLKIDVKKYYPSIDNNILKEVVRKKIKDPNVLWILDEIINSTKGLPIGNYISQIFGNLYLSELDHYMKETNCVKYYFRYCDDIIILGESKDELNKLFLILKKHLAETKNLNIKSNWQIFPVKSRGIDFLGYRFFHNYTMVRKNIVTKFKNKMRYPEYNYSFLCQLMSYLGWFSHANTYNLKNKYITNDIISKIRLTGVSA